MTAPAEPVTHHDVVEFGHKRSPILTPLYIVAVIRRRDGAGSERHPRARALPCRPRRQRRESPDNRRIPCDCIPPASSTITRRPIGTSRRRHSPQPWARRSAAWIFVSFAMSSSGRSSTRCFGHKMIFIRARSSRMRITKRSACVSASFAEDAYTSGIPNHRNVHPLIKEADDPSKMVFGEGWHTDSPFLAQPPAITILRFGADPAVRRGHHLGELGARVRHAERHLSRDDPEPQGALLLARRAAGGAERGGDQR